MTNVDLDAATYTYLEGGATITDITLDYTACTSAVTADIMTAILTTIKGKTYTSATVKLRPAGGASGYPYTIAASNTIL